MVLGGSGWGGGSSGGRPVGMMGGDRTCRLVSGSGLFIGGTEKEVF